MSDSKHFAKLYGTPEEQVLVLFQMGDEGPEIRFFAVPDRLGVCSFSVGYEDSDYGWGKAENEFQKIDEEQAWIWARRIYESAAQFAPEPDDEEVQE